MTTRLSGVKVTLSYKLLGYKYSVPPPKDTSSVKTSSVQLVGTDNLCNSPSCSTVLYSWEAATLTLRRGKLPLYRISSLGSSKSCNLSELPYSYLLIS